MKTLVIYGSRYGNTQKLASAIAAELGKDGDAGLVAAEDVTKDLVADAEFVVIGGPTEGHRISQPVVQLLDRIGSVELAGKPVAAFDTRVRWPRVLSGSAASGIARRLRQAGAQMVAAPESFLVAGPPYVLEPGELTRSTAWAASLATRLPAREPVAAGG